MAFLNPHNEHYTGEEVVDIINETFGEDIATLDSDGDVKLRYYNDKYYLSDWVISSDELFPFINDEFEQSDLIDHGKYDVILRSGHNGKNKLNCVDIDSDCDGEHIKEEAEDSYQYYFDSEDDNYEISREALEDITLRLKRLFEKFDEDNTLDLDDIIL